MRRPVGDGRSRSPSPDLVGSGSSPALLLMPAHPHHKGISQHQQHWLQALPTASARDHDAGFDRMAALMPRQCDYQQQQQLCAGPGALLQQPKQRLATHPSRFRSVQGITSPPPQQKQQQEGTGEGPADTDDGACSAQQRLHQLLGLDASSTAALEAAAGSRILALPFAICQAADGSLFEVATG